MSFEKGFRDEERSNRTVAEVVPSAFGAATIPRLNTLWLPRATSAGPAPGGRQVDSVELEDQESAWPTWWR